jgi:hypothetical protein
MPLFVVAHLLTKWSNLPADGFSLYYQHAAGLSGTLWVIAGLFVLRRLLLRRYDEYVTTATLAAILFATGLFHYATYDSSYSHGYSFFLLAAFLDLTERWHTQDARTGTIDDHVPISALVGLVGGLIVLTRHTNVLFLLLFPLYGVSDISTCKRALRTLWSRRPELLVILGVGALTLLPQLAIYYQATGRFLISSYGDLSFDFRSPRVFGVLFSVQKGVFFWSPLLLAAICGFFLRPARILPFISGVAIVFVADTYLMASWWDWQFGSSYGHRGFIDTLPMLALGLGAFFDWSVERLVRKRIVAAIAGVAMMLSLFQMLQYWNGVLPMSDLTWDQYRAAFLKVR